MANDDDEPVLIWNPDTMTWVDTRASISQLPLTDSIFSEQDWADFAAGQLGQASQQLVQTQAGSMNPADDVSTFTDRSQNPYGQKPSGSGEAARSVWESKYTDKLSLYGLSGSELDDIIEILHLERRPESAIHVEGAGGDRGLEVILALRDMPDPDIEKAEKKRKTIAHFLTKESARYHKEVRDLKNQTQREQDDADRYRMNGGTLWYRCAVVGGKPSATLFHV